MLDNTTEKKIQIAIKICEHYATGQFTIESCCEKEGISDRTWNYWVKENAEIADIYKIAKQVEYKARLGELRRKALTSLEKLVMGFTDDEVHQEVVPIYDDNGNEIGVKNVRIKRVKKVFAPNCMAVMFALNATDSETFKYHQPQSDTGDQVFLIGDKPIKF